MRALRRERGVVLVALFEPGADAREPGADAREPIERGRASHVGAAPIVDGEAEITFRSVPDGRYAVGLVRAEDEVLGSTLHALSLTHADVIFEARGPETHVSLVPHERLRTPAG